MSSDERFRLMKEHVARIHEAVRRNLLVPAGLPDDARCRIEIVQKPSGALEGTKIVGCHPEVLENAVLNAIALTPLPAPLHFPDDPPLARNTTILDFTSKDLRTAIN